MKTKFISRLLILSFMMAGCIFSNGQTNQNSTNEEKTIRIKMVKNINGVETFFDTTIVGGEWNDIHGQIHSIPEIEIMIDSIHHGHGKEPHVIVKTIDVEGMNGSLDSNVSIQVIDAKDMKEMEKLMKEHHLEMNDAEFQKLLKEHGIELGNGDVKMETRVVVIDDRDKKEGDKKSEQRMEIKVVVKTCNIEDLNNEDRKRLKNEERSFNEKLKVDQVNFYPNPNNGRFNLGFTLEKQGDTEITIMDMNGKQVYGEKLPNFTGSYKKDIDISNNAPGTYYIKVTQGKDSFFKKMILQ